VSAETECLSARGFIDPYDFNDYWRRADEITLGPWDDLLNMTVMFGWLMGFRKLIIPKSESVFHGAVSEEGIQSDRGDAIPRPNVIFQIFPAICPIAATRQDG
jgi:hypothetical protein